MVSFPNKCTHCLGLGFHHVPKLEVDWNETDKSSAEGCTQKMFNDKGIPVTVENWFLCLGMWWRGMSGRITSTDRDKLWMSYFLLPLERCHPRVFLASETTWIRCTFWEFLRANIALIQKSTLQKLSFLFLKTCKLLSHPLNETLNVRWFRIPVTRFNCQKQKQRSSHSELAAIGRRAKFPSERFDIRGNGNHFHSDN